MRRRRWRPLPKRLPTLSSESIRCVELAAPFTESIPFWNTSFRNSSFVLLTSLQSLAAPISYFSDPPLHHQWVAERHPRPWLSSAHCTDEWTPLSSCGLGCRGGWHWSQTRIWSSDHIDVPFWHEECLILRTCNPLRVVAGFFQQMVEMSNFLFCFSVKESGFCGSGTDYD
jgi:hypothetical protein